MFGKGHSCAFFGSLPYVVKERVRGLSLRRSFQNFLAMNLYAVAGFSSQPCG
jgi:hypothetical protein